MHSRRRRTGWLVAALLAAAAAARAGVEVDLDRTVLATGGRTELLLSLSSTGPFSVSVRVEVLDPAGNAVAAVERDATLAPGETVLPCPLVGLEALADKERGDLPWYRLRVRISPDDGSPPVEATTSLATVAPQAPALAVGCWAYVRAGRRLPVNLEVVHPLSRLPLADVPVSVTLGGEGLESPLRMTATTDRDGRALLQLPVPESLTDEEPELVAEVRHGPFLDRQAPGLVVDVAPSIALVTDRPLYRPGQTVHARALVLTPEGRALPGAPITFTFSDERHREVTRSQSVTSAFGIAHADWPAPADAERGEYAVKATLDGRPERSQSSLELRLADYELPTFRVEARPDRPFYLPGEPAALDVEVTTVAGAPLAEVPVWLFAVDEGWRWWDAGDQPADDEPLWSGVTDSAGQCRAPADVTAAHHRLAERRGWRWRRFEDVTLLVRARDPASGRTASRRVALRATGEPIHVYLAAWEVPELLPVGALVSTFTADGRPVPCMVTARGEDGAVLASTRTGELGIGLLDLPALAEDLTLRLEAVDAEGRSGHSEEDLSVSDEPTVLVEPLRSFLRPGAPIAVEVRSNRPHAEAAVEVSVAEELLWWQRLRLDETTTRLEIPFDPRFVGEVAVRASLISGALGEETEIASRATVLYPQHGQLEVALDVQPAAARPGEPVMLQARVSERDGEPPRAALGLAVVDTASEALLLDRDEPDAVSYFRHASERARYGWWEDSFAGLSRRDLAAVTPERATEQLELVARALLWEPDWRTFSSSDPAETVERLYGASCKAALAPALGALDRWKVAHGSGPTSRAELEEAIGSELAAALDPWGRPFSAAFAPSGEHLWLSVSSAGGDGVAGTRDDMKVTVGGWRWLEGVGTRVATAILEAHRRSGAWPTDERAVTAALGAAGIDLPRELDPWGHPLRLAVEVLGSKLTARLWSAGPDGSWSPAERWWKGDDILAWEETVDTFVEPRQRIAAALVRWVAAGHHFPSDAREIERFLARGRVVPTDLLDPLGRPYRLVADRRFEHSDELRVHGNLARLEAKPVEVEVRVLKVMAVGRDGVAGTNDDLQVHEFESTTAELTAQVQAQLSRSSPADKAAFAALLVGSNGAVAGTVVDDRGEPLPGVAVTLLAADGTTVVAASVTGVDGSFALSLPPGSFTLRCALSGFTVQVFHGLPVRAGEVTRVEMTMLSEDYSEEITVTADVPLVETTATTIGESFSEEIEAGKASEEPPPSPAEAARHPFATPRLRKEFPETLLWVPELVTGGDGTASVPCTLADSVTTWKAQAVATTEDGRLATAEATVAAALPFYAELELPPRLTVGDALAVPVVVRNFTAEPQEVTVALEATGAGLAVEPPGRAHTAPAAGASSRLALPVRASGAGEARLRASALAAGVADAVERTATVEPYGRLERRAASTLLETEAALALDVPAEALPGSVEARLTVLPGIAAQLRGAMSGILRRPAGCGEQITSTAWLSLLYLELAGAGENEVAARARRNVETAVERLGGLEAADGGLAYWPGEPPSVVLSAHALRFLTRAAKAVPVPMALVVRTARWLAGQQSADGSFVAPRRLWAVDSTVQDTAFVARCLAEAATHHEAVQAQVVESRDRALAFLAPRVASFDEPHAVASLALALSSSGRTAEASAAVRRLAALARSEADVTFWQVRLNTPLDGWGLPGRLETTALAVQALAECGGDEAAGLVSTGALYLLRHVDSDGVWYSTPATLASLEALAATELGGDEGGSLEVWLGEQLVATLDLDPAAGPVEIDLSGLLEPGRQLVRLERQGGSAAVAATFSGRWRLPWRDESSSQAASSELRLRLACDRQKAAVGERVTCDVDAGRVAERGGMLLLEVGLPPGVEVDRRTLESSLGRYGWELEPHRLVVYLWPRPGGRQLSLSFTPRLAGEVVAAPTRLADYYNPEAEVVLAPTRFRFTKR